MNKKDTPVEKSELCNYFVQSKKTILKKGGSVFKNEEEEPKKSKSILSSIWDAILSEGNLFYYIAVLFYFVGVIDTIMLMQECATYKENLVYKWL